MEEVIERVGNFGCFQALLFLSTTSAIGASVMSMVFMVYGNYNPGWSCTNDTFGQDIMASFTRLDTSTLKGNTTSVSKVSSECDAWKECSSVIFDTHSSTVVTEWNLMCDNAFIPSMIFTIQMGGVILGSCLNGPLGDMYGRKVSLYSSLAVLIITNLACGFSNSPTTFAALRFFIGAGVGGVLSSAFLYPMEFVGGWWRSMLTAFPAWSIGTMEFAVVVYIFRDWRNVHFVTAAFSAAVFLPVFWIPESLRWCAVRGNEKKCMSIVQRMAWWNKKPPVDSEFLIRKIKEIHEVQDNLAKPSYMDLFKTARLRKYSLKFGFIWFINALIYYFISFAIRAFSGNFYLNLILFALVEVPATVISGPLSNKFGRRWSSGMFYVLSTVSCFGVVIFTLLPGEKMTTIAIALATLSKMTLTASWLIVILISIELYPTVVRNLHSGYLNALCRVGSAIGPYLVPADKDNIYIAYAVMGALTLVNTVLIMSVTESRGRPMTDTIRESSRLKGEPLVCVNKPLPGETILIT